MLGSSPSITRAPAASSRSSTPWLVTLGSTRTARRSRAEPVERGLEARDRLQRDRVAEVLAGRELAQVEEQLDRRRRHGAGAKHRTSGL